MAEHKHQQQDLRAGLQHLANRQQEASVPPVVLVLQHQCHQHLGHNPWEAEAALEAHLRHRAGLEDQLLRPHLHQGQQQ